MARPRERERKRAKVYIITVKVPLEMLVFIDELVRRGIYKSRSELIRDALRKLILYYMKEWQNIPEELPKIKVDVIPIKSD